MAETRRESRSSDMPIRALFVGGFVDNSELDLDADEAPSHYPLKPDGNRSRYRLYEVGRRDGDPVYAVYAAMELPEPEIERIIAERDYPRRFGADERGPAQRN